MKTAMNQSHQDLNRSAISIELLTQLKKGGVAFAVATDARTQRMVVKSGDKTFLVNRLSIFAQKDGSQVCHWTERNFPAMLLAAEMRPKFGVQSAAVLENYDGHIAMASIDPDAELEFLVIAHQSSENGQQGIIKEADTQILSVWGKFSHRRTERGDHFLHFGYGYPLANLMLGYGEYLNEKYGISQSQSEIELQAETIVMNG